MTDKEIKEILKSADRLLVVVLEHLFDESVANINIVRDILSREIAKLND